MYKLVTDSRVIDALEAAGGLTDQADTEWVDKYLNKSAKVSDGQKIYVPRNSENDQISNSKLQTSSNSQNTNSIININTAGSRELEALPGVGPVTAEKIIAGRPYGNIEELIGKKIVSQKIFDQIKGQISVW